MTSPLKPPAFDPAELPLKRGSGYPQPFKPPVAARQWQALGAHAGLTQFGVNLVELAPGCWSSQRHWHTHEDELVYVLEGELVLVTEGGEQLVAAGHAVGFPAGKADGHHFINRSPRPARLLAIGSRIVGDECHYPDVDLHVRSTADGDIWSDKKGNRL
ncbi:MAG TPA: cupin domain-containing protein [Alphaproteobacteria bacterium]|nr:cupin domain-containing protein [Alphaproteobacteria bacterium]